MSNIAFIDGQNLHMGTARADKSWKVDFTRFREYLRKKYLVEEAFYCLGIVEIAQQALYDNIKSAGFSLQFREHKPTMAGAKKGNVDTDIIFTAMYKLYKQEDFDKIVLVSGDGDYYKLVKFLIEENRFAKLLFPSKNNFSSLYKKISRTYIDNLANEGVKAKIAHL